MLGPDSMPQEGVPKGTVTQHEWDQESRLSDATRCTTTGSMFRRSTPPPIPACVMVFQDGQAYVHLEGPVRAPTVFDNLIHRGEMPVTIGVFINPGRREDDFNQP